MEITVESIFKGEGLRLSVDSRTIAEIWHHSHGYWYAIGNIYRNNRGRFTPSHNLSHIGNYSLIQLLKDLKSEIRQFFSDEIIKFTEKQYLNLH